MFDKTRFGPTFMAPIAVSKCADSIPLYRQAKAYRRAGVPVDDSTLGDHCHRTAEILGPIYVRLLEFVPKIEIVLADETTMRVLAKKKTRTAWIWSFIARDEAEKEIIAGVQGVARGRAAAAPSRTARWARRSGTRSANATRSRSSSLTRTCPWTTTLPRTRMLASGRA